MKRGSRLPSPWPSKSIGPEPLSGLEEDRGICSLRKWNLNVIGHICIPITRRLSREGLSQFQLHDEFEVSCVYLESCLTKGEGGEVAHCVRSLATKSTELSLIIEAHKGEKKNLILANCPLTTTHVPWCHTRMHLYIYVSILVSNRDIIINSHWNKRTCVWFGQDYEAKWKYLTKCYHCELIIW